MFILNWIQIAAEGLGIFLAATVIFDVCHYLFHQAAKSKFLLLQLIGNLHLYHHRFYSRSLVIDPKWQRQNVYISVFIEYLCEIIPISFGYLFFNPGAVTFALIYATFIYLIVIYSKGQDVRHREYQKLPAYRSGILVSAPYHALHHVYPHHFYSSYIKIFDYLFGTANPLKGKIIALTGASGALGSKMKTLLEREGATILPLKYGVDYTYTDYQKLTTTLQQASILCLCHGTKYIDTQQANCDSFVEIISRFQALHRKDFLPVEVWGVGSEIECHPCFGIKKLYPYANSKRKFAKYAKQYLRDKNMIYRHIVHSAFNSQMGKGLMTANFAAKMTIFFIKRGFIYIPITYTGFAFFNYLKFLNFKPRRFIPFFK